MEADETPRSVLESNAMLMADPELSSWAEVKTGARSVYVNGVGAGVVGDLVVGT